MLDNFEHLLGATPLVTELLMACPRLVLLVTSRTALRLRDERRFFVPPLATPDPNHGLEVIAKSPAVQLFVERAQAATPDFLVQPSTANAIAQICRRLDGLPLSIELAAARAGLLGPATHCSDDSNSGYRCSRPARPTSLYGSKHCGTR